MSPASAEYTVSKTYIDWILDLPWKRRDRTIITTCGARRRSSTKITTTCDR